MKKAVVIISVLLCLALSLASCSEDKAEETVSDGWSAIYRP